MLDKISWAPCSLYASRVNCKLLYKSFKSANISFSTFPHILKGKRNKKQPTYHFQVYLLLTKLEYKMVRETERQRRFPQAICSKICSRELEEPE